MQDGPSRFKLVPHQDAMINHQLEVGSLPTDYVFNSATGPFLRANEELGCSREVVEFFKFELANLPIAVFKLQGDCA